MLNYQLLAPLGWQAFFQNAYNAYIQSESSQHLLTPARVVEHHKKNFTITTGDEILHLPLLSRMPEIVVGDWLLLDAEKKFLHQLERK